MANLLITLLVIGMSAAILAAGVNYGGTAYYEARAEARATELIAHAAKIAQALVSWSRANNGSRVLSDTSWSDATATDLVPSYLDRLPRLDSYAQGNGASDYYFKAMPLSNVSFSSPNTEGGTSSYPFNIVFAVITDNGVCNAIARISRGPDALPRTRNTAGATMGDFTTPLSTSAFDCIINDANNNSAWDSGESMFFIYRVF